jgi:hypothetical protein
MIVLLTKEIEMVGGAHNCNCMGPGGAVVYRILDIDESGGSYEKTCWNKCCDHNNPYSRDTSKWGTDWFFAVYGTPKFCSTYTYTPPPLCVHM